MSKVTRPRSAWEWDRFAALVVSMFDEHVGPTQSMGTELGCRGDVWWACFSRGWYRSANFAFVACRPVTAAWQAGALARHMFEEGTL